MTARRQARGRTAQPALSGPQMQAAAVTPAGVPRALAVGPLLDVWADPAPPSAPGLGLLDVWTARRRWSEARRDWLRGSGAQARQVPSRAPWSLARLSSPAGRAERAGTTVADPAAGRLAEAGCTVADLPNLRAQAEQLHKTSRAQLHRPAHAGSETRRTRDR